MLIGPEVRVADIASQAPATIRIFQQHGIDFCCGGKRPLSEACAEAEAEYDRVRQDLEAALVNQPAPERSWAAVPLTELTDHIVSRYHQPLRQELARLSQMADKVADVHGERHPETVRVREVVLALREELLPHMDKEEQVLFPYLRQLEAVQAQRRPVQPAPFGTALNPIRAMQGEHEAVGDLLAFLRALTEGYTPPPDACNTFRGLYHGLREMERELQEHIHLENNVQFPRLIRLEEEVQAPPPRG